MVFPFSTTVYSSPFFPFAGKNQVAVGLVTISFENKSSESALSVYSVAIANCKENRLEDILNGSQVIL